jgi:hypothetical protein
VSGAFKAYPEWIEGEFICLNWTDQDLVFLSVLDLKWLSFAVVPQS